MHGPRRLVHSKVSVLVGKSVLATTCLAAAALLLPALARSDTLVRVSPDWSIPDGWAISSWSADNDASQVLAVRGSGRVTSPQSGWERRDLFLLHNTEAATPLYGPESGVGSDPIHRASPSLSDDGVAGVFATYRKEYPQGSDLRLWQRNGDLRVIFQSGTNFDLDFPAISADGRTGAVVEVLPLTADNHVFRMRVYRWSTSERPAMLIEHQNRHITGLDVSGDGGRIVYTLQNSAEKPDSGEIRILDADGSGRTIFQYLGVAGPVAISADGSTVAAFLPGPPAELGGPRADDPGVYLWRDNEPPLRIDEANAAADRGVQLAISADGRRVSWWGYLWEEGAGVTRVLGNEAGPGSAGAQMTSDGLNWTMWLPEGPGGAGLYRLRQVTTHAAYFPIIVNR